MMDIIGMNVPEAYSECIGYMRACAQPEESRNGPVLSVPWPVMLTIKRPTQRVLFSPIRDANPFFHLMEFVWMMSGSDKLEWIKYFNSRFGDYSDDGKTLPASYGVRWRRHWGFDQITTVIQQLSGDPTSRRAVLGMWDPGADLTQYAKAGADRPCNTHAYFRIVEGRLNMTVCNRSNDAIWGMLGANAVHMTMLQELVAAGVGKGIGTYYAMTNNLHIYKNMPNFEKIWSDLAVDDPYNRRVSALPLLFTSERVVDFLQDAEYFVNQGALNGKLRTHFFNEVVVPMSAAYVSRKEGHTDGMVHLKRVAALDWRLAGEEWIKRRDLAEQARKSN